MSHTVPIEGLTTQLAELISDLHPGEEIKVTAKDRLVARIIAEPAPKPGPPYRRGGSCKGMLIENPGVDDDAHLADFKDYMA